MKKIIASAVAALGLITLLIAPSSSNQSGVTGQGAAQLPSSLEKLYPPQAPGPIYLGEMIALSSSFSGTMSDLFEDDLANAVANFDRFRQQYARVAEMVPEWKNDFPTKPVEDFDLALKSPNRDLIMKAAGDLGAVCHSCHVRSMAAAYHRFHWGDFGAITTPDPISGQDVSFASFMQMIEADFSGIGNDLQQGQIANAQQHLDGFRRRYAAFKETCAACHDSERHYYVDAGVFTRVDSLESLLSSQAPNGAAIGELLKGIGQESCSKCHLVHVPAAYARLR